MQAPVWGKEFYVNPSVGDDAIGAMLLEKGKESQYMRPICCASRFKTPAERGYLEIELVTVFSGDMDLPLKEDLGVRRAKLERQKGPYLNSQDSSDEQDDAFEDEFYQAAKRLKVLKMAAKEDPIKITMPEPIVEEDIGKRHITYQMEKNKGLTPHRKKLTKNPRKKYKLKHQKAVIRRKGQVREIKRPSASYGGEATGIRTTISRSVRFHN
ncbi:hypothetical protein L7F22_028063 [Adiantum nelumboides]|nr:hypothetical protein [Adiantum nelumboides]